MEHRDSAAPEEITQAAESDGCPAPHLSHRRLGRYELGDRLGSGAMGVVYRARDPELDRPIAIKVVRPSRSSRSSGIRLLREAQAMARVRHPNVVPIFDVGLTDDAVFVTMPLLEAGTLRDWLRAQPRSLDAILDRFLAAGRGLAATHAAGLVHRDFKPENVLLGGDGEVQVADFGLVRITDREREPRLRTAWSRGELSTQTGDLLGTPAYMSPEQLRGRPSDARADQFSFCVALWEAVYGAPPFPRSGPGPDLLRARLDAIAAGPTRGIDRPAWLIPLLVRGLAADPDRRWPTLQALLDAIAARRRPRRWVFASVAAGGLVALVAIAPAPRPDGPPPSARGLAGHAIAPPAPDTRAFPAVPLAHYEDLRAAAISPDGTRLAVVTGDSLVIQSSAPGGADRILVEHGVFTPIAWSPDSRRIAVGARQQVAGVPESLLLDVDDRAQRTALTGMAAFLSPTELAVVPSYRHRDVAIYEVGHYAAAAMRCAVPGDYTFLWSVAGLPDGTIVVATNTPRRPGYALVMLRRDCRVRATFTSEPISGFAITDAGTLVAARDGHDEILEISADGAIVSRRAVRGVLGKVLGRRLGTDYVTTLAQRTDLVRIRAGVATTVYSTAGNASFELAPDGVRLAWIVRDGRGQSPGTLWLSTLQQLKRSRAVVDNALTASWSPGGGRLAILVSDAAAPRSSIALTVVDPTGGSQRRVPVAELDPDAAPVWLDDHRIAMRSDDRTTYVWFDLDTGARGELVDRHHGSTLWLARSPRDGTLAMWRMGAPDAIHAHTRRLWLQTLRGDARAIPIRDVGNFLVPSWSPTGELLVRAYLTGEISRVALDTGELTPIARVAAMPPDRLFDDHVMTLPGGDLLAINRELGANVATVGGAPP
jgi:hypothetical protein